MSKPTSGLSASILYFASAASFTKKSSDQIPAPLPITELFGKLEEMYPGISEQVLKSCAVTINLEYVDVGQRDMHSPFGGDTSQATVIQAGDEVALIPPVSSG